MITSPPTRRALCYMDKSGSESQALHTPSKYSLKKLVSKKKSTEEEFPEPGEDREERQRPVRTNTKSQQTEGLSPGSAAQRGG